LNTIKLYAKMFCRIQSLNRRQTDWKEKASRNKVNKFALGFSITCTARQKSGSGSG